MRLLPVICSTPSHHHHHTAQRQQRERSRFGNRREQEGMPLSRWTEAGANGRAPQAHDSLLPISKRMTIRGVGSLYCCRQRLAP